MYTSCTYHCSPRITVLQLTHEIYHCPSSHTRGRLFLPLAYLPGNVPDLRRCTRLLFTFTTHSFTIHRCLRVHSTLPWAHTTLLHCCQPPRHSNALVLSCVLPCAHTSAPYHSLPRTGTSHQRRDCQTPPPPQHARTCHIAAIQLHSPMISKSPAAWRYGQIAVATQSWAR